MLVALPYPLTIFFRDVRFRDYHWLVKLEGQPIALVHA